MIDEHDVRRIALSLPETSEKLSWGTPFFRVRNRGFARIREEGDLTELTELLTESWRHRAPHRLVTQFDATP